MANTQSIAEEIVDLERHALARWGNGDPKGFLELYAPDISYFDPMTAARIDGYAAMVDYYRPWTGKIQIPRTEMLKPQVVVDGNLALLTYNLVNYMSDAEGVEAIGSSWNSTTVFQQQNGEWKSIHSHWSFTRHPALQNISPEESERQSS